MVIEIVASIGIERRGQLNGRSDAPLIGRMASTRGISWAMSLRLVPVGIAAICRVQASFSPAPTARTDKELTIMHERSI